MAAVNFVPPTIDIVHDHITTVNRETMGVLPELVRFLSSLWNAWLAGPPLRELGSRNSQRVDWKNLGVSTTLPNDFRKGINAASISFLSQHSIIIISMQDTSAVKYMAECPSLQQTNSVKIVSAPVNTLAALKEFKHEVVNAFSHGMLVVVRGWEPTNCLTFSIDALEAGGIPRDRLIVYHGKYFTCLPVNIVLIIVKMPNNVPEAKLCTGQLKSKISSRRQMILTNAGMS
jgi:hypothetical protein